MGRETAVPMFVVGVVMDTVGTAGIRVGPISFIDTDVITSGIVEVALTEGGETKSSKQDEKITLITFNFMLFRKTNNDKLLTHDTPTQCYHDTYPAFFTKCIHSELWIRHLDINYSFSINQGGWGRGGNCT